MEPFNDQVTDAQLDKCFQMMKKIRFLDWEIPAQTIATLFYIASHEGCHKQALEDALECSPASGSRNTDWLSKRHRLNKPGLDLISKEVDPDNKRRLILKLTPKGKAFVKEIKSTLYDRKT
jgi:DNA-binding MarR family transcriptional regulator